MKTLKNNVILYDRHCPMCRAYTGVFTACGLLDRNGRSAYDEKDPAVFGYVDAQRARNEIALVDLDSGQATYGLDSLIRILGHQRPLVNGLLRFPFFYYPLRFLYALVSYNRKLIAPSSSKTDTCLPDFNLFYRLMFLLFTSIFTGFILFHFITPILKEKHLHNGLMQEMLVVTGQVVFQSAALLFFAREKLWDYLGNMMTVSTIGAVLLIPAIIVYKISGFHFYYALAYFAAAIGTMFWLHLRRCKKLGLDLEISASWVLYRILVVIILMAVS